MSVANPIAETYQQLTTTELLALASDAASLRPDVIPYLRDELRKRNQNEDVIVLTPPLIERPKTYRDFTKEELNEMIRQRIETGETLEAIKIDLKHNGIDIFDIVNEENRHEDETIEYIVALKDEGFEEDEIAERLKTEMAMDEEQVTKIKTKMKKEGGIYLIIGYGMVILFSGLVFAGLETGISFGIDDFLKIGAGFLLVIKGHKQRR
jgi:hypothetical protein